MRSRNGLQNLPPLVNEEHWEYVHSGIRLDPRLRSPKHDAQWKSFSQAHGSEFYSYLNISSEDQFFEGFMWKKLKKPSQ